MTVRIGDVVKFSYRGEVVQGMVTAILDEYYVAVYYDCQSLQVNRFDLEVVPMGSKKGQS